MIKSFLHKIRSLEKRLLFGILVGFVILCGFLITGLAQILTDYWWFQSLGFGSVWSSVLLTKIALVAVFSTFFGAVIWANLYVADRVAPAPTLPTSESDFIAERYRSFVAPRKILVRTSFAIFLGLLAGANAFSQWQKWILFRNAVPLDIADPVHGKDVTFYMLKLPFYSFITDWLFAVLTLTLIVSLVAHFLNGTLTPQAGKFSTSSGFKVHLSLLLGSLALARAIGYYLDRFQLLTADNGGFTGVMATDSTVRLPGLTLLVLISLFAVALLIANIRRPGWGLAIAAVAVWGVSHLALVNIFPALHQRFRIDPVTTTKEAPYVERNIEATRFAYGLDRMDERSLDYQPGLSAANVEEYESVIKNVPLVDKDRAVVDFNANKTGRGFFRFSSLDIDRYSVDGVERPMVLATRGLDLTGKDSWEERSILFTHGRGVEAAAAYGQGKARHPLDYKITGVENQNMAEDLEVAPLKQPQIYFYEGFDGYAVVGTDRQEIDYQDENNKSVLSTFNGDGGVPMGSLFRRMAFSLRFKEIEPLISSSITSDSKVLMNRDIKKRIKTVAPFLKVDSDPYPVVADGKVFWMVDAYTHSSDFPYSESVADLSLDPTADMSSGYNYVRNSAKVVVDAYNGDISIYVIDTEDPLMKAWRKAFPSLFKDKEEMPENLRSHIRYPKDIFDVQTDMWSRYVIEDAAAFIQEDTRWSVATQPTNLPVGEEESLRSSRILTAMKSQYVFNRLPEKEGEEPSEDEYLLQRALVPKVSSSSSDDVAKHLTAIVMARSDWDNYGELVQIRVPSGRVQAPDIADTEIRKFVPLTEYNKDKEGNKIDFGEMNLVLAGNNIVYIRSVYAESGGGGNVPELERVVAMTGDNQQSMGLTVDEAIQGLITTEQEAPADVAKKELDPEEKQEPAEDEKPDDPIGGAPSSEPETVFAGLEEAKRLFAEADRMLSEADDAVAAGDQERAAELRQQAQEFLKQGTDLLGG